MAAPKALARLASGRWGYHRRQDRSASCFLGVALRTEVPSVTSSPALSVTGAVHQLDSSVIHQVWDNSIPPRLEIDPGDTVVIKCRDAGNGYYTWDSKAADVLLRVAKGHPLSGPIRVRGAKPGDVLQVEILDLVPGELGFTQFRPGRGLLADDFAEPYLKIWDLRNGESAEF